MIVPNGGTNDQTRMFGVVMHDASLCASASGPEKIIIGLRFRSRSMGKQGKSPKKGQGFKEGDSDIRNNNKKITPLVRQSDCRGTGAAWEPLDPLRANPPQHSRRLHPNPPRQRYSTTPKTKANRECTRNMSSTARFGLTLPSRIRSRVVFCALFPAIPS